MYGGISLLGLFVIKLGLASTYTISTFGPKLSIQNKTKAMKSKMKAMILAHNNRIIS
jgi:purine-cytosine permease-like protein